MNAGTGNKHVFSLRHTLTGHVGVTNGPSLSGEQASSATGVMKHVCVSQYTSQADKQFTADKRKKRHRLHAALPAPTSHREREDRTRYVTGITVWFRKNVTGMMLLREAS